MSKRETRLANGGMYRWILKKMRPFTPGEGPSEE